MQTCDDGSSEHGPTPHKTTSTSHQPTVSASRLPNTVSGAAPSPPVGASSCSARASRSHPAASAVIRWSAVLRKLVSDRGVAATSLLMQRPRVWNSRQTEDSSGCIFAEQQLLNADASQPVPLDPALYMHSSTTTCTTAPHTARTCGTARQRGQQLRIPPGQQRAQRGVHQLQVDILCEQQRWADGGRNK